MSTSSLVDTLPCVPSVQGLSKDAPLVELVVVRVLYIIVATFTLFLQTDILKTVKITL